MTKISYHFSYGHAYHQLPKLKSYSNAEQHYIKSIICLEHAKHQYKGGAGDGWLGSINILESEIAQFENNIDNAQKIITLTSPKLFDPKVSEALGFYVYALKNSDNKIFYVGKGLGNRCFEHIDEAIKNKKNTAKLDTIREILAEGKNVNIDILRHGLDEQCALEVEATLIDVLNLHSKGNLVQGHGVSRSAKSAQEISILYGAQDLCSDEPLLLIKINRKYKVGMSEQEVYDAVRWAWKLSIPRAKKAKYILAVAHGIVRGVFKPTDFHTIKDNEEQHVKDSGRVHFEAEWVSDSPYLHCNTKAFMKKGQASPIRYLNC